MRHASFVLLSAFVLSAFVLSACAPAASAPRAGPIVWMGAPAPPVCAAPLRDASDASVVDAFDPRPADFDLVVLEPTLTVAPGESVALPVRIERRGGFDAPVLIDLWGMPPVLFAQPRESRVGDSLIELTIEADPEATSEPETPFAIQASARGIRRVARATIEVR